ncbi:DMT family transporter [Calderihabitans maritimus]|uniref:EamA domain-containing protein n=1 Tax=Calderihabitans maritimus TaxID=1246530 RepID=A0A1Z5HRZ1_9FIRM|nr:DMT family transporter [Calderihabitans maritimus]GAW92284.1 protein of unknown function DUF6 transmembrane [Calderihabitans maritimus]
MGIVFALVTAFSFSASSIFVKRGLRYGSSDSAVFYTIAANVIFFGIGMTFLFRGQTEIYNTSGLIIFLISGILGPVFGRFSLYKSISYIGASRSASLKIISPVFSVFLAFLFLREWLNIFSLLGMAVVLTGVYLLKDETERTGREKDNLAQDRLWFGILWGLFSAFLFAATNVARKLGLRFIPSAIVGSAVSTFGGLVAFTIYYLAKGKLREIILVERPALQNFLIAGLLTCSAIFSYFVALSYVSVPVAMTIANTEPLFTLALSKLWREKDEAINLRLVFNVALIVAGVTIIAIFQ